MILDLDKDHLANDRYDICIIGSGAAGTALASEFEGGPLRVLVCEAGGLQHETATQDLYQSDVTGLPFVGAHIGRFRVHGGTTTKWGGQALPLMREDFEVRDWVPYSGWPIKRDDLDIYYRRALQFLLIDDMDFDEQIFTVLGRMRAGLDPARLWHHFAKWSPQPDLRGRHTPRFKKSANVCLLLHANLTELSLAPERNHVQSATFRSLTGRATTIKATQFVLCVGGIETARVLLSNNKQCPAGIGNQHDLVGRFFQDHPAARVANVRPIDTVRFQRLFNFSQKKGLLRYSTRVTATNNWQRSLRMLNVSGFFNFEAPDESGVELLKSAYVALRRDRRFAAAAADLLQAALRPRETLYPLWRFATRGEVFTPMEAFQLTVMCEQEPSPESRITLSQRVDPLGVPRADIKWQISESVRKTIQAFTLLLRDELSRTRLAEMEFIHPVMTDNPDWRDHMSDQYHHIGTARMGAAPENSVVDADLRLHGIPNLSIASSAVFPTGGHSNPTLTILALTFRLADRLSRV
jgi:choline dehydrogenase-like flavoprotein